MNSQKRDRRRPQQIPEPRQHEPRHGEIILHIGQEWFDVEVSYHPVLIPELKLKVHKSLRRWNVETKRWSFHKNAKRVVEDLLKQYMDTVDTSWG